MPADSSDAGLHVSAQNAEGLSRSTEVLSRLAEGNTIVFPY